MYKRKPVLLAVAVAGLLASLSAGTAAQASGGSAGTPVPTPVLTAVSADSATDAWAVGCTTLYSIGCGQDGHRAFVEHWNGTKWSAAGVGVPKLGSESDEGLIGVSAVSPTDVWAVGYYTPVADDGLHGALILHWNGTRWSQIPSPSPGGINGTTLTGVSAISPTDAWAVGYYFGTSVNESLALHWNGTSWKQAKTPSGPGDTELNGVSAISAQSAWAVGFLGRQTLALHWNGSSWSRPTTPNPIPTNVLTSVSADSATDIWSLGTYPPSAPLMAHGNGTKWTQVSTPTPGSGSVVLRAVQAFSVTSAWAVGSYVPKSGTGELSLLLHWTGTKWVQKTGPSPHGNTQLFGVAGSSATDVWAVGFTQFAGKNQPVTQPVILHWDGTSWRAE